MRPRRRQERAFRFARGVRISGTNIACDTAGGAAELAFLSHAQALGAARAGFRRVLGSGHQELLVTEATLALLGTAGARLRRHALPAVFGRPFALGAARVELFPSGHLPGSASLLVEVEGRRLVYAGSFRTERPAFGAPPAEMRPADALCIDGTFGDPCFTFPAPEQALLQLQRFAEQARSDGAAPVLLTPPFGTAMDAAATLARAGFSLRGHRAILAAAAAFRISGATPPAIARFGGRLRPGEVLLWPPEAHDAPLLARLAGRRLALVSGFSLEPETLARVGAEEAIPLSNHSGYPQLLAYVEASGAKEVAVFRGHAEQLAARLRERGHNAYALGPPRQMELFRG
jgi:hypothetical protein